MIKFKLLAKLSGHTAVLYKHFMFIYGGKISPMENSSNLYKFDYETSSWSKIKLNG